MTFTTCDLGHSVEVGHPNRRPVKRPRTGASLCSACYQSHGWARVVESRRRAPLTLNEFKAHADELFARIEEGAREAGLIA